MLQEKEVKIIRKIVENSHDLWLNARQADRGMLELATRAQDPRVRRALVQALNDSRPEIARIKATPEAKRIAEYMKQYDDKQQIVNPTAVAQDPDVDMTEEAIVSRRRARPVDGSMTEDHDELEEDNIKASRASKRARRGSTSDQDFRISDEELQELDEEEPEERNRRGMREDLRELMADFELDLPELRRRLKSLTHKEQANFSFDDWLVWKLCQIDHEKEFTDEDLNNNTTLERALRLLYLRRIGRTKDLILGRIHINYDAIPRSLQKAAERQAQYFHIDNQGVLKMRGLIKSGE